MYRPYDESYEETETEKQERVHALLQKRDRLFFSDGGDTQYPTHDEVNENEILTENQNNITEIEKPTKEKKTAKKRGRPAGKVDENNKDWSDEETFVLIELWEKYEILYNTKLADYKNRDIRSKTLEKLKNDLEKNGITSTIK